MAQIKGLRLGGIGSPCCCGGCTVSICAVFCGKNVAGVSVSISGGGSGTTDATGCVSLTIPSAGTYNVTISLTGFTTRTQSKALTCGGSATVQFNIANTLTLTDSSTTITLTNTGTGHNIWRGCYELAEASTQTTAQFQPADQCDCPSGGIVAGNCDIEYQLDCGETGGPGVWTLTRQWGACCWSAACNTAPFTAVYSSNSAMNLTTCTGGRSGGLDSGTTTQAVLAFPFTVTLTSGGFGPCFVGGPLLPSPLTLSASVDV